VPLGDVVSVRWEQATPAQIASGEVALLDRVSFDGEVFSGSRLETKMAQFVAYPGDLVVSKIRARQGSIGVVQDSQGKVSVTIHYRALQPDRRRVDVTYAWLALRSAYCRAQFLTATGGAMKGEISEEALLAIKLPLPPLAEQRAIVERWRKAQADIAAANQRVELIQKRIPQLVYDALGTPAPAASAPKQKLLALRWSEINRWSLGYLQQARAGLLGFMRSRYPVTPLREHLVETMNGYCIKPVAGPTPYRMLKLNALAESGLDLSATKYVNVPESVALRFSLRKGDLLICRSVGSFDLVAKCAVVESDAPGILFPDIIIRARLKPSLLTAYVCEVMQTPLGRAHFQSNARTAVGMWKIGADDIANFPIPVPPKDVQRALVERVAAARAEMARERAAAEKLHQSIAAEVEALILGSPRA